MVVDYSSIFLLPPDRKGETFMPRSQSASYGKLIVFFSE
jgi:hypothetical protein